jgi:hypothetical protein
MYLRDNDVPVNGRETQVKALLKEGLAHNFEMEDDINALAERKWKPVKTYNPVGVMAEAVNTLLGRGQGAVVLY